MYEWFCPKEGRILDPFAGGSVRGIVAAEMGYVYNGIDLSEEQIDAVVNEVLSESQWGADAGKAKEALKYIITGLIQIGLQDH